MKKRALTLSIMLVLLLSLFVPLAFAVAEGEEGYESSSELSSEDQIANKPIPTSLGYSIREFEKKDCTYYSLTSSYVFNAKEIKSYADSIGKDYEYGIVCFIPSAIGNDAPISPSGDADVTALKYDFTDTNGVCDLTIPSIIEDSASDEFVFAAYFRFGKDVYYSQAGKIITDYKELSLVTCSLVLDKLNNAQ